MTRHLASGLLALLLLAGGCKARKTEDRPVAGLHAAAAADCQTAGLEVDRENVTGALRLYEGLGFRVHRTQVSWTRTLPPLS